VEFDATVTVFVPVVLYVVEKFAPVPVDGDPPDADQENVPLPFAAVKDAEAPV
jgi:hypothetical protein